MSVVYNDHEPYVCKWLEALMRANALDKGAVIERSITDLSAADVQAATQAHFFAGIGVWSYALKLAGWPPRMPVWTGSCPCQPFSSAGLRNGKDDERHLWPHWFQLIRQCRPPVLFGEQVASEDGLHWLDTVSADLEAEGYAVGAADLCAAGVGAPHGRQRLYFVALRPDAAGMFARARRMANAEGHRAAGDVRRGQGSPRQAQGTHGQDRRTLERDVWALGARDERDGDFWTPCAWVLCGDGKERPIEPGTFPMVDGASTDMGRLRAYGNAIVPQLAHAFVASVIEHLDEQGDKR